MLCKTDYKEFSEYMSSFLKASGGDKSKRHPFRSRISHTLRVVRWAERLAEGMENADTEVLYTAAIFHDISYGSVDVGSHEEKSAYIFIDYARKRNLPEDFIKKVGNCIRIHSDKELLEETEKLTLEQILLMEADLLDEEGALAVVWDCLAVGMSDAASYNDAREHIKEGLDKLDSNPMVTEKAKKLWTSKQSFLRTFFDELTFDLETAHIL
jgi:uncharacterized protein